MGLIFHDDGWRLHDALWGIIKLSLPEPKKHPLGCHNPRVSDRSAMNAILFVLRTGCQWNALNMTGICSCSSAYRRFREWTKAGVFSALWIQQLVEYDKSQGIDWAWTSMDGALTKAPLAGQQTTGANPTDRGKQGVKRSVLTDGAGIPLAVAIDGANRHDMKLVRSTLEDIKAKRPDPTDTKPQGICLDKGYDYDEVREIVKEFGFTAHIRSRGEEAKSIKQEAGFKARRWVVERTHSWMNRFRRILVRWEKLPETYIAMLHLTCALITLRAYCLLK
ncbi:IS5 family transposase [Candidatus Symbiobacter mobilis]|uniref:IS5 family transposase n=1 Tax=Candidatus Symbiobacter mobilis TaxID=1436290 RepID=UPI0009DC3747|nr:IS5 family transposase [Candidatus Symbiobacter mobilis]